MRIRHKKELQEMEKRMDALKAENESKVATLEQRLEKTRNDKLQI